MMAEKEQQQKETEELKQKLGEAEEEWKKQTTAAVPTPTVVVRWRCRSHWGRQDSIGFPQMVL